MDEDQQLCLFQSMDNVLMPQKLINVQAKRLNSYIIKRRRKSSETKGGGRGGVNEIGFASDSDISITINDKKIPPIEKCVQTQTDEVDPVWAEESYPSIEDIEVDSLRIVSVVPRDIQLPYYKNDNFGPRGIKRRKLFFIANSSQTQIKIRELYPNFKGNRVELPDIPYVRSKDWSNTWTNESNLRERDNEWLLANSTDNDSYLKGEQDNCAEEVHRSWKLYINMMRCLGRWPFYREFNSSEGFKEFVVKKSSVEFWTFVSTSSFYTFILFLQCTSLFVFFFNYNTHHTSKPDQEITALEFDKYWPYLFWNMSLSIFIFYWNLLLTFNGIFVLEYMNRFSKSVEKMKYVPTDGIRIRIWWWLISFILYATILSILFAIKFEPVYYGSGLTATFVFSNIWTGVRFSYYYPTLRFIGLIYHLCLFFNFNSIIVHIVIHIKFLENMASKWNIRFAYRFKIIARDKLEFYATTSEKKTISSYAFVPIETILKDNQIIASLSRHISKVFRSSFNIYIFISGWMISVFLYRAATYILTTLETEEVFVKKRVPGIVGLTGDEIYYEDDDFLRTSAMIAICCYLSISWFLNSRAIASCGETIMSGFKLVQRYGLIRCKDANERLMIKSLAFQFGPTVNYYLDFGFKFDKAAVFNLSAYIFIFGFGLLSFSPFNLSSKEITACLPDINSGNVICKKIYISRVNSAGKESITSINNRLTEIANKSLVKDEFFEDVTKNTFDNTSFDTTTVQTATVEMRGKYCTEIFNGVPLLNPEKIPDSCDFQGNKLKPYGENSEKDCVDDDHIANYRERRKQQQEYFCEDMTKMANDVDDCLNRKTAKFKVGTREKVELVNELVTIKGKVYQMCCWDYGFSPESLSRCNMVNSELAALVCPFDARGGGFSLPYYPGDLKFPCDTGQRNSIESSTMPNLDCNGVYNFIGCDQKGHHIPSFPQHDKNFCPLPPFDKYSRPYTYNQGKLKTSWVFRCDIYQDGYILLGEDSRDDCGNVPYFRRTIKESVRMLVNGVEEYFCCFDYLTSSLTAKDIKKGIPKLPNSLAVCHIGSDERRNYACKNGSKTPKKCS